LPKCSICGWSQDWIVMKTLDSVGSSFLRETLMRLPSKSATETLRLVHLFRVVLNLAHLKTPILGTAGSAIRSPGVACQLTASDAKTRKPRYFRGFLAVRDSNHPISLAE